MKISTTRKTNKYCDFITKKVLLILFLGLAVTPGDSTAQELISSNQKFTALDKHVSVDFDDISLDAAMLKIGQKTRSSINYNADLFEPSQKITFSATDLSLSSLLEKILPEDIAYEVLSNSVILRKVTKKGSGEDTVQEMVTGQVLDAETGEPLPGVNILIKGTEVGTTTDSEGEFELSVSDLDVTIVVSYIGYESKEISLQGREELVVELNPVIISGEELVVVGYGVTTKEDLTGSVSSIRGESFENIPAPRIDQLLQGRAPGVQVTQSSGAPGTSSTIRIRGGNSIEGDNSPLFVIDDFIVGTNFNLNNLNNNDIESIEVLKDATAVAVYGTRGANGVILITTKSGERVTSDTPEITLNTYTGMQYMMNTIDLLSGPEQAAYANDDAEFRSATLPFSDLSAVPNVNWIDQVTRNAAVTNTDLSVSGQSENRNLNYYISGNYFNQRGIIRNSGLRKYNLRTNFDLDLSNRVRTGVRLNLSRLANQNNKTNFSSVISSAGLTSRAVYNEEGSFTAENPVSASLQRNAEADILLRSDETYTSNLLGNIYLEIEPASNLVFRTNFGSKIRYTKSNIYNPAVLPENLIVNDGGDANVNVSTSLELLNENTILYTGSFSEEHTFDLLGGFTWQTSEAENVGAAGYNFPNDALRYNNLSNGSNPARNEVNSGWNSFQLVSWLARTNYAYRDKYLFTFVGRVDGSSRFAGTNNKYAFFPSAAVAWQLGKEPFVEKLDFFDQLKLRASFGYSGSQAINSFRTLPVFSGTSAFFNGSEQYAVQNGRPANEDLKWETTKQLDIGLEAAFLNNRISIEADYYRKTTNDLLLNVQIPRQTGFASKLQNLGSIQNNGLEFRLNSRNITSNNFLWSTTLSVSGNRNKVLDLGGVDFIDLVSPTSGGPGGRLIVGESAPVFVGVEYMGTWKSQQEIDESGQQAQQVGGPRFKDTNGDGDVSVEDFEVLGSPQPDFFGGIQNTFIFKNWEMDVFLEGTFGNEIYNSLTQSAFFGRPESNKYAETLNRWTPENSDSDIPRAGTVATLASVYSNSEMVEDGSYLRLKNLKLTYNVPTDRIGLNSFKDLAVYFSGTNLLLMSDFRLFDPEVSQYSGSNVATGFSQGEYPYGRTFTIGVRATL